MQAATVYPDHELDYREETAQQITDRENEEKDAVHYHIVSLRCCSNCDNESRGFCKVINCAVAERGICDVYSGGEK